MRTPKSFTHRVALRAMTGILAIVATAGMASPAKAQDGEITPFTCPYEEYVDVYSTQLFFMPLLAALSGGPGGTMSQTVSQTITATATISGSVTVSGNILVAQAEMEIGASLSLSTSLTNTMTYSNTVPPDRIGHIQFGVDAYTLGWSKYRVNTNCTTTQLGSGTAKLPVTGEFRFKWWTTPA